jgi:acetyl esterase/lipase
MHTIKGQLDTGRTAPAPDIECWVPTHDPSGIGLVIFPGGGYGNLADHEGADYARHFRDAGVACFVVKYRLGTQGYRHPAMLEDGLAAIAAVRSRAAEFAVDPGRLGVMGSSAGGHLAAHTLVAWQEYRSAVPLRPAFGVLCYPVIAVRGPYAHEGSRRNLAGDNPAPELLDELSCAQRVCGATPPCFLWHTVEDTGVPPENSLLFAAALRQHGVPFELHLYQRGAHGLGLGAPFAWAAECRRWLAEVAPSGVAGHRG